MNEKMPEEGATQEKLVSQEDYVTPIVNKPSPPRVPQFIPKLLGKKIIVRPIQGQPVTGTLEGFNNYELKVLVSGKKEIIIFKHGVFSIEASP